MNKSSLRATVAWFFGVFASVGLVPGSAQAAGLPLIMSATVDYSHNTLTISGQNFGSSPAVNLNSFTFSTQSTGSNQIVANFPGANPPSSFAPGTYFLTLQFKNQLPSIFTVDIGANGAQGPAGAQGAAGSSGAIGATGPAGPAGPQGVPGPIGPAGATGVAGAPGPAGALGATGASGAQGAAGPQGPQGVAGTNGTGVPVCTAPNFFLIIDKGALECAPPPPRYVDNGDGTTTDNQTGLMWEQKTGTVSLALGHGAATTNSADVHDVNNTYAWSASLPNPDGTLFSSFLTALNQNSSTDGSSVCFAQHCDWRIPTAVELRSIFNSASCNYPTACIDTAFGPTQADYYWSSTSLAGNTSSAWYVAFDANEEFTETKSLFYIFARAVRGGR